tara:strand:+ start:231 stop:515 length:285 start_codon:yes stop_codon:yes gene_type:complete
MSYARASKRAQRARSGAGGPGADGSTTNLDNGKGGTITVSNGSVINYGGNAKFGLYSTVGKSVGFLNLLSSCCRGHESRSGVNLNTDYHNFMQF